MRTRVHACVKTSGNLYIICISEITLIELKFEMEEIL